MKKLLLLSISVLLIGACQQENVGGAGVTEETKKTTVKNEEKEQIEQSDVEEKEEEEEEQIESSTTGTTDESVEEVNIYEEKTFPEMERIFLKMKDDWFDYWIGLITAMNFYQVCHLIYHAMTVPIPRLAILLTKITTKPYRPRVISLQGFLFVP